MKRVKMLLCAVLAALMLVGCGGQGTVGGDELPANSVDLTPYTVVQAQYPVYPKQPLEPDYYTSGGEWDDEAFEADWEAYEAALAAIGKGGDAVVDTTALTVFAEETLAQVFSGDENTVYSPVSLYMALAMLTELTEGETRQQVMTLLRAEDADALRQWAQQLWMQLYCDDGLTALRLANAAFVREGAEVHEKALDVLADSYYASAYRVPMGTEEADKAIAEWLDQQTNGLLAEDTAAIRTQESDLLRLYNTLYYKAGWINEFFERGNTEDTFTTADGAEQTATFMHRTVDGGSYLQGADYLAASLGLRGGKMTFVLPDEGVSPQSLLQREGFLSELKGEYDGYGKLEWSVPKFDVHSSVELNGALQALGVTRAFDMHSAEFAPLADWQVYVSKVMQAARVKIDEKGVEAAAYTEVVVADSAAPADELPVVEMDLDRPFIFVIWKGDVPLFIGTVQSPAA